MATETEVLDKINEIIREEKGNRVTINDTLVDASLDSFGITVLFIALDDEYGYFKDIPEGEDVFATIPYATITIREIVSKCL